jgi:hypothetical protein
MTAPARQALIKSQSVTLTGFFIDRTKWLCALNRGANCCARRHQDSASDDG